MIHPNIIYTDNSSKRHVQTSLDHVIIDVSYNLTLPTKKIKTSMQS